MLRHCMLLLLLLLLLYCSYHAGAGHVTRELRVMLLLLPRVRQLFQRQLIAASEFAVVPVQI